MEVVSSTERKRSSQLGANEEGGARRKTVTNQRVSKVNGKVIAVAEDEIEVDKTQSIECLINALKNPICKEQLHQLIDLMPETRAATFFDKVFSVNFNQLDTTGKGLCKEKCTQMLLECHEKAVQDEFQSNP